MGDLEFEEAYEAFGEVVRYGTEAGADLIHIETMSDTYELKAAVLAAKENTDLPVFVTTIFDERGKLLTGADVPAVVALLEGLRVDALGINCGPGPKQMLPILDQILEYTSLPVIVKPNAGLPKQVQGETVYDVLPRDFCVCHADDCGPRRVRGGRMLRHDAGTHQGVANLCRGMELRPVTQKEITIVSSYGRSVCLGSGSKIIGERINPTGKKKFRQALKGT